LGRQRINLRRYHLHGCHCQRWAYRNDAGADQVPLLRADNRFAQHSPQILGVVSRSVIVDDGNTSTRLLAHDAHDKGRDQYDD
jgi:hypothetical protein